jgi:hypothetical protein
MHSSSGLFRDMVEGYFEKRIKAVWEKTVEENFKVLF